MINAERLQNDPDFKAIMKIMRKSALERLAIVDPSNLEELTKYQQRAQVCEDCINELALMIDENRKVS